eukprot:2398604-Rhodomonas_salina.1
MVFSAELELHTKTCCQHSDNGMLSPLMMMMRAVFEPRVASNCILGGLPFQLDHRRTPSPSPRG